jgi:hypothetical protein
MKVYALFSYNLAVDDRLEGIHHEQQELVNKAIEKSAKDEYTYRLESWENGFMIGGWRFFSKGNEFTQAIKDAIKQ